MLFVANINARITFRDLNIFNQVVGEQIEQFGELIDGLFFDFIRSRYKSFQLRYQAF